MKKITLALLFSPLFVFCQTNPHALATEQINIKSHSKYFSCRISLNPDSTYRLILNFYFPKKAIALLSEEFIADTSLRTCESQFEAPINRALSMLVFDHIRLRYEKASYWDTTMGLNASGPACFVQGNNKVVNKPVFLLLRVSSTSGAKPYFTLSIEYGTNEFFFLTYTSNRLQSISSKEPYNEIIKRKMKHNHFSRKDTIGEYSFVLSTQQRHHQFAKSLGFERQQE